MNKFELEVKMMEVTIEITKAGIYEHELFNILYDTLKNIDGIDFDVFGLLYKSKRRIKAKGKYTMPNFIKILCRVNRERMIEFLECNNPILKETFITTIVDNRYLKHNKSKRYTFSEARDKIAKSIKYIHPYWVNHNMSKYLKYDSYTMLDIIAFTSIIDYAYRTRKRIRVSAFPRSMYDLKDLIKIIQTKDFINEEVSFINTAHRKVEGTPDYVRFPKPILEYWEFYEIINSALIEPINKLESAV